MIKTNDVFISIPKSREVFASIVINGTDVTAKVMESSFTKPLLNLGIGDCSIKVNNTGGIYSGLFPAGSVITFKADNLDGTNVQFLGRVDYPAEQITNEGQYITIQGRHKSFFLSERRVCYSAINQDCGEILRTIFQLFAPECSTTNIQNTNIFIDVNYDYTTFTDCIKDLMKQSGYDAYIEDDLSVYFFLANSILNSNEAIAEGDNFISTSEQGNDNYYEKTRVIVVGQDDVGIPIVYTAINGIDDTTTGRESEDGGIREIYINNPSLDTLEQVSLVAISELQNYTNRPPQGSFKSYGLETIAPGENLWIAVPRQKIYGIYKAVEITHLFGIKIGGWRTQLITEIRPTDTRELINIAFDKTETTTSSNNVNKLNYSYNMTFSDNNQTGTITDCSISNGKLVLQAGKSTGTWVSTLNTLLSNMSKAELRIDGSNIESSVFEISLDNGSTWQTLVNRTLSNVQYTGKLFIVRITLNTYFGAGPELNSAAILYS